MKWLKQLKINWQEICIYLCFVVLATILWYGHAMTSVRNAQVSVAIHYTGVPERVSFVNELPSTIQIEVRDAGNRLLTYFKDPPKLTIDLSSQIHGSKGEILISEDVLRRSLSDLLQGTSKLQQVTPEHIEGKYYTQHEKMLNIRLDSEISAADEYQLLGDAQLSKKRIKVHGRQSQLDTIQYIPTERLVLQDVRDSARARVALVVPHGLRVECDSVDVLAISERYTEKVMVIPVHTRNVPEGQKLRIFPREVSVTLRVSMAHFAEIGEHDIHAYCHYPQAHEEHLPVELHYTNPHISSARVSPSTLEFIIEKNNSEQ